MPTPTPFILCVLSTCLVASALGQGPLRLTQGPGIDDEPCFSPDGKWIVYQSRDATGRPDLWVVPVTGGDARQITSGPGYKCFPTWSPDGRRIVFASDPDRADDRPDAPSGEYDLYAIDRVGDGWSQPQPLTRTPRVREYAPAYSPDGTQLAFTAAMPTRYRLGDNGLFVMAADGDAPQQMDIRGVQNPIRDFVFAYHGRQLVTSDHGAVEPTWSRDGKLLAYTWLTSWAAGNQCTLAIVSADAELVRAGDEQALAQLTGFPCYGPAFSPVADQLAFVMSKGDAWDLWLLEAPYNGKPIRLTDHPANDVNPAWSPDGKRIAFASNREGTYDIHVMAVGGGSDGATERRSDEGGIREAARHEGMEEGTKARRHEGTKGATVRVRMAPGETGDGVVLARDWGALVGAGVASRDGEDTSRWTVVEQPPEGRGLAVEAGPVLVADIDHDVPDLAIDPQLSGWYIVSIGLYLPPEITYTGVAARLGGEDSWRCIADPRASIADRGHGYDSFLDAEFVELEVARADLTGRHVELHHPAGCRSHVTYLRFTPLDEQQVAAARARATRPALDVHQWLDVFDYTHFVEMRAAHNDWWQNSPRAIHRIVRYFQDYGATCPGYRFMGGGRARYPSRVLAGERERYIDKRIEADMRPWISAYRYGDVDIDLLAEWVHWCHFYGCRAYATWCFEESHGYNFLSSFNVEHPQFLARRKDGRFNLANASLAHPEVLEHKLAIAREVLARGVDGFNFDFQRIYGWYQRRDMTNHHKGLGGWDKGFDGPAIAAYQQAYGVDPRTEPANHRRWVMFSTNHRTEFFRRLRKLCDAAGRPVSIVVTLPAVSRDPYTAIRAYGCDWETLVAEGLIDGFAPIIPPTDPAGRKQTIDDVVDIMTYVHERCRDRCDVIWPLSYYKRTVSGLAANSGLSVPAYTKRIVEEARRHGAAGVNLTTVDHNMTSSSQQVHIDTVMQLRRALAGGG